MRKNILIISIILSGLFSCKNEKSEKESSSKKSVPEIVEKNSNPIFSQNDFTLVYQYLNGESNQLLGINIADKKTLKFHLVTETLPCNTEYWGIAKNENWNSDGEVDGDEEGGYFVEEYLKEEKEYIVGIRLAEDLSKVQIKYIPKDSIDTDCLPITETIMKRIK